MKKPPPKFVVIFAPKDAQRAVWVHKVLQDAGYTSRLAPRHRSPLVIEPDERALAIISDTSETTTPPSEYLELVATGRPIPITFDGSPMPQAFRAVKTLAEMVSVSASGREQRAAELLERIEALTA